MIDETTQHTTAGDESGMTPEDKDERAALASLQAQLDEAIAEKDKYHRAYSDAVDFSRRAGERHADDVKYAAAPALMQMLSSVDDLERAFTSMPDTMLKISSQVGWIEGISLIYQKLLGALQANGVTEIEAAAGGRFDPNLHEAISRAPGTEGTVVEVLQKGYMLHDRVLRPTLVQVGDGTGADGHVDSETQADA